VFLTVSSGCVFLMQIGEHVKVNLVASEGMTQMWAHFYQYHASLQCVTLCIFFYLFIAQSAHQIPVNKNYWSPRAKNGTCSSLCITIYGSTSLARIVKQSKIVHCHQGTFILLIERSLRRSTFWAGSNYWTFSANKGRSCNQRTFIEREERSL